MRHKTLLFMVLLLGDLFPARLHANTGFFHKSSPRADVQFFGDLYIPTHVQNEVEPGFVLDDIHQLLRTSQANIVNFEGAATRAFIPMRSKQFVLRMPLNTAERLSARGVTHATLANNHAMDWGLQGLFDTITTLERAGIGVAGAGMNALEASQPLILSRTGRPDICINAVSRTFPKEFWAGPSTPGSASPELPELVATLRQQRQRGCIPLISIHWGSELTRTPQSYQRRMAHHLIDAGAAAVIGHHPHLLQEIEIHKNAPIFYSIGNFAFGTRPAKGNQEGLAVRMTAHPDGHLDFQGVAINVSNSKIHFRPRLFKMGEADPLSRFRTKELRCSGRDAFTVCFSTKKTPPAAAVLESSQQL